MKRILTQSIAFVALVLCVSFAFAQGPRVKVSNDDPRWGEKITITYTAQDGSVWAQPNNADTLFCATNVRGVRPEHAIVQPMRHVSGPMYQAELTVPDSTNSLWIEICIPTDRVPDGITIFTCRTRNGKLTPGSIIEATTNMDSAIAVDLQLYPKDYTIYAKAYDRAMELKQAGAITLTDSARKRMLIGSTDKMLANPDNSIAWQLGMASIYSRRRRDSLEHLYLANAARCTTFDPIFNDGEFWQRFFAPVMTKTGIEIEYEPGRILAPLIERFPRTEMAHSWMRSGAFDTLSNAGIFRHVAEAWKSSHDVDVLESISQGFAYAKSPVYDPKTALVWFTRTEESSRTGAGFYSGDNIFSSMGRLPHILSGKASVLITLGRTDEAITLARTAMTQAKQPYEKQEIGAVLAKAYLAAGRLEDAKRAFGMALAASNQNTIDGLEDLYAKAKNPNETQADFAKRLIDTYGSAVDLPIIPDFHFTTLDGMTGSLAGLRGKVVVLDCWFTTCAGCIIEKASMNKLVESFNGDTNVVFLSVALNDAATVKRFLEHTPSKFKIVPDGQDICNKIGVNGYPTHIVIGRDGKTLGFDMGGSETEGETMRPKIERALGKL